jgi:regulatory protein
MANRELSKAEWLDKAEAYCAKAEHCAADVRRKLFEWQAPSELADFIEEKLRDNDFINDARFCHSYVHDKVEYQSWGRIKIQAGLRALQLPESDIRCALEELDETKYRNNLRALIVSRRAEPEDKLLRFLLQRGFTFEEIKNANNLHM